MANSTKRSELESQIGRIDEMVQRLEEVADPVVRATAKELIQSLMALHGAALERIVEVVGGAGAAGEALMDVLGRDELVRSVLVLYALHPVDVQTRVEEALEKTRPYLRSHGGNVELVGIDDGESVRLRLQGSCDGCPSSAMTLKSAIEDAIRDAAPEVTSIIVVDVEPRPVSGRSLPVVDLTFANGGIESADAEAVWHDVEDMDGLAALGLYVVAMGGHDVLFCRLSESLYAYGEQCPACGHALGTGRLAGRALTCAACGDVYDVVKAGRGLTQPAYHLTPFPLLVENGRARVALPLTRVAAGSH